MRIALGAAVLVACIVAQAGRANGGGDVSGDASLQTSPAQVNGIIGSGAARGIALAPEFRLRVSLANTGSGSAHVGEPQAHLRRRFSSSMIDYYPLGDGFHLSAGGRLDNRQKMARAADAVTAALLYAPKSQFGQTRGGFKRFAPAATMGYGRTLAPGMVVGVEGGALLERGNPDAREMNRFASRGTRDQRFANSGSRINPVAQVSFAYRF